MSIIIYFKYNLKMINNNNYNNNKFNKFLKFPLIKIVFQAKY